jgi:hypothetical protein
MYTRRADDATRAAEADEQGQRTEMVKEEKEGTVTIITRPGQVERTNVTEGSELWTPLKTGAVIGLLANSLFLILHAIVLCVWSVVDSSWPLSSWWSWFSDGWWLSLVIPCLIAWPVALGLVVVFRYVPELRNRNWPPPYESLDPAVGLVDAYGSKKIAEKQADVLERMYRARSGGAK